MYCVLLAFSTFLVQHITFNNINIILNDVRQHNYFITPGNYIGLCNIKIDRTIILHVILYGCETWSLTLREERNLRVFENMVLRRIFGPR